MSAPQTTAPSQFSPVTANFSLFWDSTSLGLLKECPRKYWFQMILGWQPKSMNIHLTFGQLYASGVERYAHAIALGRSHDEATLDMVKWALGASGERAVDIEILPGEFGRMTLTEWRERAKEKATLLGGPIDPDPPTTFSPWESLDPIKNRYTLIRTLVWNVEDRKNAPLKTVTLANGKPAVELSFRFEAFNIGGETVSLCGHLDEIVALDGTEWVKDDKAQPTFCKVLTLTGWKEIGKLVVGEEIAGDDGYFHPITALHSKGSVSTYLVDFQDGTYTYCAEDHLWSVSHDGVDKWKTLQLKEFMGAVNAGQRRHVPITLPVAHSWIKLPVDPYLLGVLLGDGYLGGNSVSLSTANEELIPKVQAAVDRMGDVLRKSPSANLVWTITNNRHCATLDGLRVLGLWGCLSADKFIPNAYMFASIDQRRALLQGLLDTDGSWSGQSRRYQTMSSDLAEGVADLVRSLGGTAVVTKQTRGMYRVVLRIGERGIPIRRRYIKSVTEIGNCENICIGINSPSNLYLTDYYIVTHNTTKGPIDGRYFAQYSPHNQMSLYAVAGKVIRSRPIAGVLVRAAQIGVGFSRFATRQVPRPQAVLDEWMRDTEWWIGQARAMALANHWPPNDKSCGNYGGCAFQRVCAVSPAHRPAWLKEDFVPFRWNPLDVRGDI